MILSLCKCGRSYVRSVNVRFRINICAIMYTNFEIVSVVENMPYFNRVTYDSMMFTRWQNPLCFSREPLALSIMLFQMSARGYHHRWERWSSLALYMMRLVHQSQRANPSHRSCSVCSIFILQKHQPIRTWRLNTGTPPPHSNISRVIDRSFTYSWCIAMCPFITRPSVERYPSCQVQGIVCSKS